MRNKLSGEILREMGNMSINDVRDFTVPCFRNNFIVVRKEQEDWFFLETYNGHIVNGNMETIKNIIDNVIDDIQEIGKYLIGEVRDDTSRVFVNRLTKSTDLVRKNGWWDIFSLAENTPSCGAGTYLFSLVRFTYDKDGNTIAILKEVKHLGDMSRDAMSCMAIVNPSKFVRSYITCGDKVVLKNIDAIRDNIDILNEVLNGTFDEEKFKELLNSKTPDELDLEAFYAVGHQHNHPLYAKIQRMNFNRSRILEYVYRIRERYTALNLGDETDIVAKAIAVERYYTALHKVAKDKKKEEKKKKKNV